LNGGRSVNEITFGSEYIFNSSTYLIASTVLDATHFVVAYKDGGNSNYGTAIIGTVSGNVITYGAEYVFKSGNTIEISVGKLDATHFVIAYSDYVNARYGTTIAGTITNDNEIAFGSEYIFNAAITEKTSVSELDASKFVITYADGGNSYDATAIVATVTGSAISFGSEYVFNNIADYLKSTAIDATHFVAVYRDASPYYGTAVVGTVSGTTITFGSEYAFNAVNTANIFVSALDDSHIVVAYKDISSTYGKVVAGSISGSTISFGSSVEFLSGDPGTSFSVSALSSAQFTIAYPNSNNSNYGSVKMGTRSGNTLSLGTESVFNNASTDYLSVISLCTKEFVVSYQDGDNSGAGIVGEINTTYTQDTLTDESLCKGSSKSYNAYTEYASYAEFNKADDDWIEINGVRSEISGTNRSMFMWMRQTTTVSGEAQVLLAINSASGGNICNMQIGINEELGIYDGANSHYTGVAVTDGEWHFVGYTYDETTNLTKMYVDGVMESSYSNGQSVTTSSQISLGQEFDGSSTSNHFEGEMTEVSIWDVVLTDYEVSETMDNAIESSHSKYINLQAYYPMNLDCEEDLSIVYDASANSYNGVASASDIQSNSQLLQVTGFNAAKYFTKSWKKGGTEISTADELGISAIDSDAGSYQLELYRNYYTITDDWNISITSLPVVSLQPFDTLSAVDESAFFETAGAGGSTYTYKWGQVFSNYANKTTTDGLGNNYCAAACESNGIVYAATLGGVSISANGGSGTFINKTTANGLGSNSCWGISESEGVLCVATNGGLGISTDGGSTFVNKTTTEGLGHISIKDVFVTNGVIYAATYGGFSFSTDGGVSFVNKTTADGLGDDHTWCVYVNSSGNIYVGTEAGISISTDGGTSFSNYDQANNNLGNDFCRAVFEVNSTIYVATSGGGLSMSTDGGANFVNRTVANSGLGHNSCYGVFVSDGTIYVATKGGGLSISTDGGTSFVSKTTTDGLGSNSTLSAFVSGDAKYIGTAGGLSISPLWDEIVGETAASMDLTTTSEMDNAYYSAQITSTSTGCINYSDTVQLFVVNSWNGSTDTDWNNTANWAENALPTLTDTIIIRDVTNKPVISATGTASCNKLIINSGVTLTLESTASGTGSLIANGNITNNGTITAQRYSTAGVWHGISSPLSGTTANTYYLNGNPDVWLKEHSESTNAYTFLTSLTTPLSEMKGFFIWVEGSTAKTFNYVGDLIQGQSGSDNNLIRSAPGTEQGWNFVGNPFTSAIDWNASSGWTKTNVDGTIYIYNSPNWATWNGTTGTNGGTQYIASGQGFFVNVTDDGSTQGTLKIDDGTKVHNTVGFLKNQERAISELVRLKVSNDTYTDETVIYFEEAATEGYDPDFDAHKLFSFNTDAPQIFSTANDNMAINVLPIENTEVPVDVIGVDGDNMIITATEVIGFGDVFILDNYTGIQTNLSNSSYEFMYEENITDRFLVFFTTVSIPGNQSELIKIYSYENNVRVIIPRGTDAEIVIYNLIGQKITQAKAHAGINDIPVYETGYYLVKIMDDNNVVAKKVFIR
ncbi:MAG: T9SS type A sorting domain-containing protein, partial [Chlorobi bacterium]|nr:T9SS type A sorting domain-containing protein [Chlorobiota bacterium]